MPDAASPADEFSLTRESDNLAIVEYWNADPPNSAHFPETLTDGDLTVEISVHISSGPETLIVTPPEGWVAIPPSVVVTDGETGTVELRRGEYLGF